MRASNPRRLLLNQYESGLTPGRTSRQHRISNRWWKSCQIENELCYFCVHYLFGIALCCSGLDRFCMIVVQSQLVGTRLKHFPGLQHNIQALPQYTNFVPLQLSLPEASPSASVITPSSMCDAVVILDETFIANSAPDAYFSISTLVCE